MIMLLCCCCSFFSFVSPSVFCRAPFENSRASQLSYGIRSFSTYLHVGNAGSVRGSQLPSRQVAGRHAGAKSALGASELRAECAPC